MISYSRIIDTHTTIVGYNLYNKKIQWLAGRAADIYKVRILPNFGDIKERLERLELSLPVYFGN